MGLIATIGVTFTASFMVGALVGAYIWDGYHRSRNRRVANALRLWVCSSRTVVAEDVGMLSAVVSDLENH